MIRKLVYSLLPLMVAGACTCTDDGGIAKSDGLPEVDKASHDFGKVRINETSRIELNVFNRGRTRLKITGIERVGLSTAFRVAQPPSEIASDASAPLAVTFAPDEVGATSGTLVLKTDSAERPEVRIVLSGEGVQTQLRIEPAEIDFGLVEVDSRVTKTLTLVNEGDIVEDVLVGGLVDGSPHFSIGPVPGDENVVRIEPGATAEIPVSFQPLFADRAGFVSGFDITPCETCAITTVTLKGAGIEAFLDIRPKDCLDFGLVNPGSTLTKDVTVTNLGTRPLNVLEAAFSGTSGKFTIEGTFPAAVGADDTLVIPVTYTPDGLVSDTDSLVVLTDDPKAASVPVCVRGTGGGPDVTVQPGSIDFGNVAVGVPRTRTIRINNAGLTTGGPGVPLLVTSATLEGGSTEFTTSFTDTLSVDVGRSAVLSVTYSPDADGEDAETLLLETNDADSPVLRVPLTGKGRALPPCEVEIVPGTTLDFGNVDRSREVVLPLAVRNTGTAACIVDTLEVAATSDSAFFLPDGAIPETEVAAGETLSVKVAFKPTSARAYTGNLTFNVSDPANPARTVALKGLSAQGCLLIAPNEIDFGTVGAQCASREKSVTIYNTCTTAVDVTALELAEADVQYFEAFGLPATFPVRVTGANSVSFRLRYRPAVNGEHAGGFFVTSDERPEPYLISMRGRAADDATQTDNFFQENRPKVDLLFVVDNSGSMSPYQEAIATNFAAFMTYANAQQVDYHIAVTTTDVGSGTEQGRFVPLDNPGLRVLTPETPNVDAAFADNINVGTHAFDEQGFEGAYLALNPNMLQSHNQGFLRDDALLSIIVVSDEPDQSPQSVSFYYNYFINIKGARRANLFSWSSIVETDSAAYIDMAKRTGGIVSDINTDNWARDLEELGALAFGYKNRFFLTSTPERAQDIEVYIDEERVNQQDGTIRNWSYDAQGNSVEFSIVAIPEPGSTVEVRYKVACGGV